MQKLAKKVGDGLKTRDSFGDAFHMKLDNGDDVVRSVMGSICSILVLAVVVLYMYQKTDVLISKKDVDVLSTINDSHFNPDYIFGYEEGFNMAVAFTAYDNDPEPIEDPTIGELVFNHYTWGPQPDGSYFSERARIKNQHTCT